ncbi:nucleotidyltransferase substrate binding protein (TIGR01987 family) [Algoriphagus aquaeductus]|jgi:nucleotidyltransferase substrate binding protein (TIGR01987 family)|uniref:Nucleotidyltransferase substrate binding protein (TIGR01987 family) n=1 Tax=Algoriphagus aquaeductus TaxID=475299 RepID=A0A326RT67_9BACT|nr:MULTISPECIES: nucleotidyltransferase substrate binding protein [Algoriphagus]PZV83864.1 nucleotidyltransferase substrate binding protein (TIGR01987 family) [Algoriphagus aquaeductus]
MENMDVRWKQRLQNFKRAFIQLEKAVKTPDLNELERQGLIKAFEFTYELAWTTLKDYLIDMGYTELMGSKDTFRQAFQLGLISDGEIWMEMVKSRNLTSHTYNQDTAESIEEDVITTYYPLIKQLLDNLETKE